MNIFRSLTFSFACCMTACSSGPSDADVASKIKEQGRFSEVAVTKRLQTYEDSYRSPSDSGTSYIVEARVKSADGRETTKTFKIFVAKSDGWVAVGAE